MVSTKELRAIAKSESSYEKCHISYRGYMSNEINAAREVLQKYKKVCSDSVKELRDKTDMPMSECCDMLRCLWRDAKLECIQAENAKLRELSSIMLKCIIAEKNKNKFIICWECPMHKQFDELRSYCCLEHEAEELGIEVTK